MGKICTKTVGTGTPTDNQVLKFDSGSDEWGPENESGGGGGPSTADITWIATDAGNP